MNVFYIPVGEEYLIYSPLQGMAAFINSGAFHILQEGKFSGSQKRKNGPLRKLGQMLKQKSPETPAQRWGPFRPNFLGLITTRSCNLACSYCDFQSKEEPLTVMNSVIAFRALDWMADYEVITGRRYLNVHFFGGEPFLPMNLVKKVVARAKNLAQEKGLRTRLVACTNGTFSEKDAFWIRDHFDSIILSVDGPAEVHNQYRPMKGGGESFSLIHRNAKILNEGNLELGIRVCVFNKTVKTLEETVQWLLQEYKPSIIAIETIKSTDEGLAKGLGPPDPWEFVKCFARSARTIEAHSAKAVYSTSCVEEIHSSFCPVGNDGFILDPQGRISACYQLEGEWRRRGMDLFFGRITPEGEVNIREEDVDRLRSFVVQNKPRCQSCFCKWHCAGGCHISHTPPGCSEEYSNQCQQTRSITLWKLLRALQLEDKAEWVLENPLVKGDGVLEFSPGER